MLPPYIAVNILSDAITVCVEFKLKEGLAILGKTLEFYEDVQAVLLTLPEQR